MAAKNETRECTEHKQNACAKLIYTDIILMPPMEIIRDLLLCDEPFFQKKLISLNNQADTLKRSI